MAATAEPAARGGGNAGVLTGSTARWMGRRDGQHEMERVDTFVVNVSLPYIARNHSASADEAA